tara:strand:- start:340 stop:798 length:459 start_codon:yes stop_codon:yes gene_type:complete
MGALSVTNSFTAGAKIVASQMNTNFTDVVTWATTTPTLSTSGSATTVSGSLTVTEAATFSDMIYLRGTATGSQKIQFEGATDNTYETTLVVTDPTADRTITFPDATGTVALSGSSVTSVTGTAPIVSSGGATPAISITTNNDQLLLNNQIFS